MFYLLDNPVAYRKLKAELTETFPDPLTTPTSAVVARLPYLISSPCPLRVITTNQL